MITATIMTMTTSIITIMGMGTHIATNMCMLNTRMRIIRMGLKAHGSYLRHKRTQWARPLGPTESPGMRPYEKNPKAIYAESFATVAREADLKRFPHGLDKLVTRVIHACGMVEVADRLAF